ERSKLIQEVRTGKIEQVRISGGGARSRLWRQIIADVLDVELVGVNTTEGAAYGAALLAGVGAGVWGDVAAACEAAVRETEVTNAHAEEVARYGEIYPLYRRLYPALSDVSHRLAAQ
ncbi:MAG: xylulokinase, partial [Anaerolineae bacterium]|nr:xylulokinase [Anaerolineae bacterium]